MLLSKFCTFWMKVAMFSLASCAFTPSRAHMATTAWQIFSSFT